MEQTIRAATDAYARGDLDGALSHRASAMRFHTNASADRGAWRFRCKTRDDVRSALVQITSALALERYERVDLIVSGYRAATRQHLLVRSRANGHTFETQIYGFWTVQNGEMTELIEFADTAELASQRRSAK